MKEKKIIILKEFSLLLLLLFLSSAIFGQMEFEGLHANGEGGAAWDADGSGPEPANFGHGNVYYYHASSDYVDPSMTGGTHCTGILDGFPEFSQALADNGYTAEQVTMIWGLRSLGNDIEGEDWWSTGSTDYISFGPVDVSILLDGEMMVTAKGDYELFYFGPQTGYQWWVHGCYLKVADASGWSSQAVMDVAAAFMEDMDGEELTYHSEAEFTGINFNGNGRAGSFSDVYITVTKGTQSMPMKGLYDDNEGIAGWDADGTGPEPAGNGHGSMAYYTASPDYDGINPSPDAAMGHIIDLTNGFHHTNAQLEYRGYETGDLKIKQGLASLGPDVEGVDWGYENGIHWCNYYNNPVTIEVGGEPIFIALEDTNQVHSLTSSWISGSSYSRVYDVSAAASEDAQAVANSFMRDLGDRRLWLDAGEILSVPGAYFNSNGRNGGYWEITEATIYSSYKKGTFLEGGTISGYFTPEFSPYFIDGDLEIESGQALHIQPGVEVYIRGPYVFDVNGRVVANGTYEDSIMFTRSNPNFMWDGFDLDGIDPVNDSSSFDHCTFEYALAQGAAPANSGGAMCVREVDKLSITNSVFRYNRADINSPTFHPHAGAIALWTASPFIQKCIFHNNYGGDAGAIVAYNDCNPVISNCLFYYNEAYDEAGALEFNEYSTGKVINCTFAENMGSAGGALHIKGNSSPEIVNCIIWGNEAGASGDQVLSDGTGNPSFTYCNIEGGLAAFGGVYGGTYENNMDEDPLFLGWLYDYPYGIDDNSPCYNAGTPDMTGIMEYLPATCLCGNPRIMYDYIDMGPYEFMMVGTGSPPPKNTSMNVYPNPGNGLVNIDLSLSSAERVSVSLYNTVGKEVARIENGEMAAGENLLRYDISHLPEGMYLLRVKIGTSVQTTRIIKVD